MEEVLVVTAYRGKGLFCCFVSIEDDWSYKSLAVLCLTTMCSIARTLGSADRVMVLPLLRLQGYQVHTRNLECGIFWTRHSA